MTAHVVPVRVYLAIFVTLLALTALTITVAFVDLGVMNTVIMLVIAFTKATLVVLYFMHVRWSSRLTRIIVSGAFIWLGLLVGITLIDALSRASFP
jgi:cytochrome c oxidase subunit IV